MALTQEDSKPQELESEQAYFDDAHTFRERRREALRDAPRHAPHRGAAAKMKKIVDRDLESLRPPTEAVAFGRFDLDEKRVYVGYNGILDDKKDEVVVNWQAPYASPWYLANVQTPMGVRKRRSFQTDGNTILDFEDVVFAQLAADVAALTEPRVDDALLSDLERERTGDMQDIVRTIQAAQYGIIRTDLDRLLVVQGGAGTGKTAIALHRVSWLLYNYRDQLQPEEVLVIGPSRAFIRYIRGVLPSLGDSNVSHSEFEGLLGTPVRPGRAESLAVARLKGELRMQRLIRKGLSDRINLPDGPLSVRAGGLSTNLDRSRVKAQIERLRSLPYMTGRQQMRIFLRQEVAGEFESAGPDESTESLLERIWPQLTAASFMQELLGSESRLLNAAGADFTAAEVQALYRRAADRLAEETWTQADVPLLDYADFEVRGESPSTFKHIVLDEAQDLSPMQLSMIARRSAAGSMTILGDLAQSTGPWGRDSWDDVLQHLRGAAEEVRVELEFGYRVPRQVFLLAEQVMAAATPNVKAPKVVRDGPSEPQLIHAAQGSQASIAVDAASKYAAGGHLVALICPATRKGEIEAELQRREIRWADAGKGSLGPSMTLLTAPESKGLEFDSVVLVEPSEIVQEDAHGYRLLYVALTRTTRHLSVVYSEEFLPSPRGESISSPIPSDELPTKHSASSAAPEASGDLSATGGPAAIEGIVTAVGTAIANQIRGVLRRDQWDQALEAIRQALGDDEPN